MRIEHLRHLVEQITKHDDVRRRRWFQRELHAMVLDELDRAATWDAPYLVRAIACVIDHWDAVETYVERPEAVVGFSADDVFPILVGFECDQHGRAVAAIECAGGDVRAAFVADPQLMLPYVADEDRAIATIRRAALRRELARGRDPTTNAYCGAALAACEGRGSWRVVERAFEAWREAHDADWYTYDGGVLEWLDLMCRLPRERATLDDCARALSALTVEELRALPGS